MAMPPVVHCFGQPPQTKERIRQLPVDHCHPAYPGAGVWSSDPITSISIALIERCPDGRTHDVSLPPLVTPVDASNRSECLTVRRN